MRYQIQHAIVKYAADTILEDINFEVRDTEKIAIVGRNGCGKTTLLKLISGDIEMCNLDSDEESGISMAGTQRIGYLKQISFEDGDISVEEEILKVFEPVFQCERTMEELTEQMKHLEDERILKRYADAQAMLESLGGYTYQKDMETVFQKFGFELEDLKRPIGQFSGGQQTKIAFVKLLLSRPDIMLLDEPTNHLDMATIEWLEGYLKNYNKAVVIVSHDRMFLDRVIDVIYEIEYHKIKRYPGNYSAFVEKKRLDAEKQAKDYEAQQKEIQRLTEWIEKWKNTPTKVAATRSKRMVIEHMVKIEPPRRFDTKSFHASFEPRIESHKEVINAHKLAIGYDSILSEVSFQLLKGQRMAVIGQNGKGKSTLLKTLISEIPSLGGRFNLGTNVEWIYFDQQAALSEVNHPKQTVLQNFWDEYPDLKEVEVRQALGNFLFSQDDVFKLMEQLSGGEKVRLALCKLFKQHPNLMILDEPTNHMDIVGKQALESMLKAYGGTVLFVSHDRYFVREIATAILDFGEEQVKYYPCGYEEFQEELKKTEEKPKKVEPTLNDVFDKKKYYNPGKIAARRKQQIEKYNRQIEECEGRLLELKMQLVNPEIASDYVELGRLEEEIKKEETQQESLLEWLVQLEVEAEEENDIS